MEPETQEPSILTVSELTNAIKNTLEGSFPSVWLQGEISNCKLHSSGHLYFSLKDKDAQIAAVMFRANASSLSKPPKDGDNVIVYGGLNIYPPSGKYQIVVQKLRFAGLGELLLKLEELKRKLHKMGWFSKERKKPIPKFPKRIGVVTSPTGAAIQDILNVLTRRFSGFHLILNPVKVQGEGAAEEIAKAIRQFNELDLVDVMIVGRGGGSIEDLWAFNEMVVAEAIYHSRIPIIAAVGHETDHCIAEYVADVRAPTPSAAAEMVIAEKKGQLEYLEQTDKRLRQTMRHLLRRQQQRLEGIMKQPIIKNPYQLLGPWMQKLDAVRMELDATLLRSIREHKTHLEARKKMLHSLKPTTMIAHFSQKLQSLEKQINNAIERQFIQRKERLKHLITSLRTIDPKNLLSKGYSILISDADNIVITSVHSVAKGAKLRALVADGAIISTVEGTVSNEQK